MKILKTNEIAFIRNLTKAYTEGVYADTPANRKLGRVGMSYADYAKKVAGGEGDKSGESKVKKEDYTFEIFKKEFPSLEESKISVPVGDFNIEIASGDNLYRGGKSDEYYITDDYTSGRSFIKTKDPKELYDTIISYKKDLEKELNKKSKQKEDSSKNTKSNVNNQEGKKYESKEINEAIQNVSPYLEPIDDKTWDRGDFKTFIGRTGYSSLRKRAKFYVKSVGIDSTQGGVIFTDGKGNFWECNSSIRTNSGYIRPLKEKDLADVLNYMARSNPKYLNNIIHEGKADKIRDEEINRIKTHYQKLKEKYPSIGDDTSQEIAGSQLIAYLNMENNKKAWEEVFSKLDSLRKSPEKNIENIKIGDYEFQYAPIFKNRTGFPSQPYIRNHSHTGELGEYNEKDLKFFQQILGLNKDSKNTNKTPFEI